MSTRSKAAQRAGGAQQRRAKQPSFAKRYRSLILGAAGAIVVGGLIVIAVLQSTSSDSTGTSKESVALEPAVLQSLTSIPASVFTQVGNGSAANPPKSLNGAALSEDGKPEVLYVGAEFCPFCAAERWPLFLALSRFGTFSDLKESHSAADDSFPNTPTLSFYGSSYESQYLAFTAVEQYTNQRVNGSYERLETLSAEQQRIVNQYNQGGGIPYIYMAGEYAVSGANFSPNLLADMTVAEIAEKLKDPASTQAKAIVGSANVLTAALCELTAGQPGEVCQSPEVVAAGSALQ